MSEENISQEATTQSPEQSAQTTQSDENVDYKALYLEEVSNSKKYRKRAQSSEAIVSDMSKAQETDKIRQLKEQEKFKELSESLQSKLDEVTPFKEKWDNQQAARKEDLLSKIPKGDRVNLEGESIKTLEYIVSLQKENKPVSPEHTPGVTRKVNDSHLDDWMNMAQKEKNKNWNNIVDMYAKKQKK